jgi:hypothetical protein
MHTHAKQQTKLECMNNTKHCAMITRMSFHWKKLMHVMLLFDASGIPLGQRM